MIRLWVFLISVTAFIVWLFTSRRREKPSCEFNSVDALVPAFNEEDRIALTVTDLRKNRYIRKIICVNDGSADKTGAILECLRAETPDRIVVLAKQNEGKAHAQNHGLKYIETEFVFLTDADTRIPDDQGIGYLISHLRGGSAAAGGIPGSDLSKAGFLPRIRASVKIGIATLRKCGMEVIGGAPHVVSGSCGLFRVEVLRRLGGIPTRTQVEDLDLTWILVENGHKVSQSAKCVVFAQECNGLRDELKRWRRWIVGYAICIRLHKRLLLSRFGAGVILPFASLGIASLVLFYIVPIVLFYMPSFSGNLWWMPSLSLASGPFPWWIILTPAWAVVLIVISAYSSRLQKTRSLVLYSPFSIIIFLMAISTWLVYGLPAMFHGHEPARTKPARY